MFRNTRFLPGLFALVGALIVPFVSTSVAQAQTAPSTYSAYTGTDVKVPPPVVWTGGANTTITDPTFGSRILRVTDATTNSGESYIPADAGFTRTFNANATAIKLEDPHGFANWIEFNPSTFKVGDGSSHPVPHWITAFDARWEWSATNPDIIYFLSGSQISQYNKSTGAMTPLGGPPNGDPVTYHAAVVGNDEWVCSAAGSGIQDTYTEIYCLNPSNPSSSKFINIPARTINGVTQSDPNWPTAAAGQTIGIHSVYGGAGGSYLGVSFHGQSWGGNGDSVFNVATGTWSLVKATDPYWSGHPSLGNGKFVNGAGSVDGRDSRGLVVRDASDLMNSGKYVFIGQPASSCCWNDGEHNSWFNSSSNPNAPVLDSRYTITASPWLAWMSEIVAAATDGSNTVWRFAHTHQTLGCYYADAFAQISNDGRWAVFSTAWDGTLGQPGGFGCASRIDTFIVDLGAGSSTASAPTVSITQPTTGTTVSGSATVMASASASAGVSSVQLMVDGAALGPALTTSPYGVTWTTSSTPNGTHTLSASVRDNAGNTATSSPVSVTVNNTVAGLTISNTTASGITSSSASVSWTTSDLADSQVFYGTTSSYGSSTPLDATLVISHAQTLSGLAAGTTYHYQVRSRNSAGTLTTGPDQTFTTASSGSGDTGSGSLSTAAVQWVNLVNTTASGTTLQKTGGCAGCDDAGASSSQQIPSGDGYVEFTASETSTLREFGLAAGTPGTTLAGVTFGIRLQAGYADVRESGNYEAETSFVSGDVFRVAIAGGKIQYSKNGTVFYTSAAAPVYPLVADASLADLGATITNAVITTGGSAGAPSTPPPAPSTAWAPAVLWTSLTNVTATPSATGGTTITKTGGCSGCADAYAVSSQKISAGNGYVEFTASETTTQRAIGLTTGKPTAALSAILYALRLSSGVAEVRESGIYRADTTFQTGDVLRVAISGGKILYSKNGAVFYTSTLAPKYPLFADAALFDAGATIVDAVIGGAPTPVVWTSLANASVGAGNLLKKVSGCDGCPDAGAVSQQQIGPGAMSLAFTATDTVSLREVGFSALNPGTAPGNVRFGIQIQANYASVIESGTYRTDIAILKGDVLRIVVGTNGQVTYTKNGKAFYTSTLTPAYPFVVDAVLSGLTSSVANAVLVGGQ